MILFLTKVIKFSGYHCRYLITLAYSLEGVLYRQPILHIQYFHDFLFSSQIIFILYKNGLLIYNCLIVQILSFN